MKYSYNLLFGTLLMWGSCSSPQQKQQSQSVDPELPQFEVLNSKETGITFRNDLKESLLMNGLFYEYFYNGGGVAVGDVNNDGLPDVYFTSNLQSNELYLNKGEFKFENITQTSGTKGKYGFPTGVTMVDINNDGWLDIYISKSGRFSEPEKRLNELYINLGANEQGVPVFEEKAEEYGLAISALSTQASFFDYDRDGDLDMFLINHGLDTYEDAKLALYAGMSSDLRGDRLYRNDNGKFVDVTKEAGIVNVMLGFGLGVSVGDMNNDGWQDIYVCNDYSGKDHLYINQQNGTFKECSNEATRHTSNFSMGSDVADYNNDGWLDVVSLDMMSEDNFGIKTSMSGMNPARFYKHVDLGLHYQYMYNALQLNNGTKPGSDVPVFSDVAQMAGMSSTDWSWAPLMFDMDNDGLKDMFISNGIKRDFRNNDFVNYRKKRQKEIMELKKQGKDFDQKAYIRDIMSKMPTRKKPNYFYRNKGDLTFEKKNTDWVKDILTNSNGAAYADFDNDGDLDLILNNSDDIAFIYKNNSRELGQGNYLKVKLEGSEYNKLGLGARVAIQGQNSKQIQELHLTRGFQSSVEEVLHFGLGETEMLDQVTVTWPDGKVQRLKQVKPNQLLSLSYENAKQSEEQVVSPKYAFEDLTAKAGVHYIHRENKYDDFEKESLLPHRMSTFGPGLAVADVNGDGLEDFFVGAASGYAGSLFLQTEEGTFRKGNHRFLLADKKSEDLGATFFDADQDGDMDLYVVSGGNEFEAEAKEYQDRLYLNNGKGQFTKAVNSLPSISASGSKALPFDFDGDGDLDLFVGGRQLPAQYPYPAKSYILQNESTQGKVLFKDVTEAVCPEMNKLGMVTDVVWVDVNGDQQKELVLSGEWMPVTVFSVQPGAWQNITEAAGLADQTGWWFGITAADVDNDGDQDLIAGNLGINYKYHTSFEEPFQVYMQDFDQNGSNDIVLGYYNEGRLFPLRGRQCSSNQMPFIKKKFPTYNEFGAATLVDVYGKEKLETSLHYTANTFATTVFLNDGKGQFTANPLPSRAQISSTNGIVVEDVDMDGNPDLILAGNLYGSEVETPRNDAGIGLYLKGKGNGEFEVVAPSESGLYLIGDVKEMKTIQLGNNGEKALLAAMNSDQLQVVKILSQPAL
ncbi:VCBS repeat-containing protein [Rapidithrix thailandica]|uniref:VCBS repeat-containing protein n=1 Tax=Rapidithrix thailandica TaxID=413964 RepID=A0AAW9SED7_9BACT